MSKIKTTLTFRLPLALLLTCVAACGPAYHTATGSPGEREMRQEQAIVSNPGPVWGNSEDGSFIGTPDGPVRLDDYVAGRP